MSTTTSSRNLRDGVLVVRDATVPKKVLEMALEDGNLQWTETQNVLQVMDRTLLDHVRKGGDSPVTGSFQITYVEIKGASTRVSLYDALRQQGNASTWKTVGGAGEDQYMLEMLFIVRNPDTTQSLGSKDEYISFNKMYFNTIAVSEGEPNKIAVNFTAYITKPTISRS